MSLFLIHREGSVIADISLTFDKPVGENEVESLLQDAINNGSLGTLKVDTFAVGSTVSGVYKISITVIRALPTKVGSLNSEFVVQTPYYCFGNSRKLSFEPKVD